MAQDISLNLKGFGFSIARATDIDMNMYAGKCVIPVFIGGNRAYYCIMWALTLSLTLWMPS